MNRFMTPQRVANILWALCLGTFTGYLVNASCSFEQQQLNQADENTPQHCVGFWQCTDTYCECYPAVHPADVGSDVQ